MYTQQRTVLYLKTLVFQPLQLLGLLPLSFDAERKRFIRSRWNLLLTTLQATFVGVFIPIPYYLLLTMDIFKSTTVTTIFMALQMLLNYVLLVSSYVIILLNRNDVENIFNSFVKIYFTICHGSSGIDGKLVRRYLRKVILVDYVLFPITFGMFIIVIGSDPMFVSAWIVNSYSIMLMIMLNNLYQSTVIVCSTLYFNINKKVNNAVESLRLFDDNESYWDRNAQRKSRICAKLSTEIDRLCYLHRMTTQAAQRITRILSLSLMLTTLFHFIVVITEVYYNYTALVGSLRAGSNGVSLPSLSSLLFIIMCILQFHYSVSFSAQMTRTAEATAIILNKFFRADVAPCVERSVETFTLEMLHHDYRIRMYDCYTMDFTLTYSAAATMSSYLIMLVQFGLVEFN